MDDKDYIGPALSSPFSCRCHATSSSVCVPLSVLSVPRSPLSLSQSRVHCHCVGFRFTPRSSLSSWSLPSWTGVFHPGWNPSLSLFCPTGPMGHNVGRPFTCVETSTSRPFTLLGGTLLVEFDSCIPETLSQGKEIDGHSGQWGPRSWGYDKVMKKRRD